MGRKIDIEKKVAKFYIQFEEIKVLATEKRDELRDVDLELSSVYHRIEGYEIKSPSDSHRLIKELRAVLHNRRNIKRDDSLLRSMVDQMGSQVGNAQKKSKEILKKHTSLVEEIRVRAIDKK